MLLSVTEYGPLVNALSAAMVSSLSAVISVLSPFLILFPESTSKEPLTRKVSGLGVSEGCFPKEFAARRTIVSESNRRVFLSIFSNFS